MGDPCGWVVGTCGCGTCWDGHSPATQGRAEALAAAFVWAATGRRYGLCEVTVLPCNPTPPASLYQDHPVGYDTWGDGTGGGMLPVIEAGTWSNRCGGGCRCAAACEVALPGPAHSVVSVAVDGVEVDPATYEIHDRHLLVQVGAGQCWPTCQTYGVEVPGFAVTYNRGDPIPDNIQAAFELLACEYAKACTGAACRLPPRLASLSRQGAEITVAAVEYEPGRPPRTGIPLVDDAISSDNPHGMVERRLVYSPDLPTHRQVTWVGGGS